VDDVRIEIDDDGGGHIAVAAGLTGGSCVIITIPLATSGASLA
jgi:hypothetical protein